MKTPKDRGRPRHPDVLTPAEWRVAEMVRHGLTNRAIGALQGVSADAVKFHVASILAKLGLDRRSDIRRWTGMRADSGLASFKADGSSPSSFGAIGQIARGVTEIGASERWYRDVLGLPHLYTFGRFSFFDCGGTRLFLSEGPGDASILYFRVEDIRAAHERLAGQGVNFETAPHLVHRHADGVEEWMAFFHDNEGRPLAIMAQVPPPAADPDPCRETTP